eukprot:TRINITY_DN4192_c0_g1_i2.p1 TRINITY_DN4192_c0_g1~~TRINITY_DN4192_c0_g1_i2.p1  ORF type:complete len:178 (-),score=56.28 TRINITY_DN4192_c0_g1_i2:99-632(-)
MGFNIRMEDEKICETCKGKLDAFGRKFPLRQPDGYYVPGLAVHTLLLRAADSQPQEVLVVKLNKGHYKDKWALPGGRVPNGEDPVETCKRRLQEECTLKAKTEPQLFGVYGDPLRDSAEHVVATVYWCECEKDGAVKAGDDASETKFMAIEELLKTPEAMAYDNAKILKDFAGKHKS